MNVSRPRPLVIDDIDTEQSLSRSGNWTYDPSGTMCHKPTGITVSPDNGITCNGREYRLSADDIEFDTESHLGTGASGTVWRGRIKTTGLPVAIKTLRVERREDRESLLNEVRGLIQAEGCPHLVQWYAGFVSKKGSVVHVVLELMDGGSLGDVLRRLDGRGAPAPVLAHVASQVVMGLDYLHQRRLLHRDIKPANVLLNRQGEVKVTDFGITRILDCTMANTCVGTQIYMSPERCCSGSYSLPSDLWSVGMVVYELATGRHPFAHARTFPELVYKLTEEAEPRLSEADGHPAALCDFVARCLTRDVDRRARAADLLGHELFHLAATPEEDFVAWLDSLE